ncbi:MAG TPA: hypothetical protein VKG38_16730 [Solirubrobacteraceae bacterium]|nr:hypothetical protein [Solirubrobacteraceae bacterium]
MRASLRIPHGLPMPGAEDEAADLLHAYLRRADTDARLTQTTEQEGAR